MVIIRFFQVIISVSEGWFQILFTQHALLSLIGIGGCVAAPAGFIGLIDDETLSDAFQGHGCNDALARVLANLGDHISDQGLHISVFFVADLPFCALGVPRKTCCSAEILEHLFSSIIVQDRGAVMD